MYHPDNLQSPGHYDLIVPVEDFEKDFSYVDLDMPNQFELWQGITRTINASMPTTLKASLDVSNVTNVTLASNIIGDSATSNTGVINHSYSIGEDVDIHESFLYDPDHNYHKVIPQDTQCSSSPVGTNLGQTHKTDVLIDKPADKDDVLLRGRERSLRESGATSKVKLKPISVLDSYSTGNEVINVSGDFVYVNQEEQDAFQSFDERTYWYIIERHVSSQRQTAMTVPPLKCKLYLDDKNIVECQKANIIYHSVISDKADNLDTMEYGVDTVGEELVTSGRYSELLIVGNAKTFLCLMQMKSKHGNKLKHIVLMIGDFHLVNFFQEILMKFFWDGGLSIIGNLLHHTYTSDSLHKCSHFIFSLLMHGKPYISCR